MICIFFTEQISKERVYINESTFDLTFLVGIGIECIHIRKSDKNNFLYYFFICNIFNTIVRCV